MLLDMDGGFTKQTTRVMNLANESAHRFNHEYIGAEHILLGLLEAGGEAIEVLKNLGIDADQMRGDMKGAMLAGELPVKIAKPPLTPRARRIILYASQEANPFRKGGRLADSADILVGLLVDNESAAALILSKHGLMADNVRLEAKKLKSRG